MGNRRGQNGGWMEHEGKMIAVNLGADFTAEHEWGIKELNKLLNISVDTNVLGIDRYRIRSTNPKSLHLVEQSKNEAALVVLEPDSVKYYLGKKLDEYFNGEMRIYDNDFASAWCEGSFGINVKGKENIEKLKKIQQAIYNRDAAMWLGGGAIFSNAGLVIGIISEIPEHLKKEMYDKHVEANKLQEASEATGIKAKIDAVNEKWYAENRGSIYPPCGYYALRPSWNNGGVTKHPVIYWLNPQEQQKNHYGWYTVEELELWIEGKGPIVERAAEKKAS